MADRFRPGRLRLEWWLIALAMTALAILLVQDRTLRRLDYALYDMMLRFEARAPNPAILLVTIDDESLARVGAWPWPREMHAALITTLKRAAPRAIGYDILFQEAKPGDAALADAIRGTPPTFLPVLIERPGPDGAAFLVRRPAGPLAQAAAGLGHVGLIADNDGVVRRVRLHDGDSRRPVAHMALDLAGKDAPMAADTVLIPFVGPGRSFPSVSAGAVLNGEVPAELLRNRILLVGATAPGLGDQHPVSIAGGGGVLSGIELQANLLDGLRTGRLIRDAPSPAILLLALGALALLLIGLRFLTPRQSFLALLLLLLAVMAASAASLFLFRIWLPPATALALLLFVYPFWSWRRLAVLHSYIKTQLEQLQAEADDLSRTPPPSAAVDPVGRQAWLLQDAILRLRTMRAFIDAVLHQLPDAVIVADQSGCIVYCTNAEKILGHQLDKGDNIDVFLATMKPVSAYGGPPKTDDALTEAQYVETVVATPDDRFLSVHLCPWIGGDGVRQGRIACFSDITQIRAVETQREELLQFLTHDMRSPQASILACLSTAREGEIAPQLADRISRYARRTLHLADSFVNMARAELQRYPMELLNLSDAVMDAVDDIWPQSVDKSIEIRSNVEDETLLVRANRPLLTRAIINLLDNAVKFSPPGDMIEVVVASAPGEHGPMALCSITDHGPGISEDQKASLFERFGAIEPVDGNPSPIGLGLSFVQAVVRGHKGAVWCDSVVGQGATFTVALELFPDPAPE